MSLGNGAAIFGCAGPELLADERVFFRAADPFGFIVFARNIETPDQLRRLTGELRATVGRDAPILVDQEGGRVQRLRAPYWQDWDAPLEAVARAGSVESAERMMRARAMVIAAELSAVGIDVNCAPVADLARDTTHPFLRNRCYGSDPGTVSRIARAVAEGFMAGGVLPVIKHLPGHGLSHVDTHHDLPVVDLTVDALARLDFAPFQALNDLPMAMTAHLVFAAIDPDRPATQSPQMIRLIREEIGFAGLLVTDDLNMEALRGTLAERTTASLAAGVDIALHCNGDLAEMDSVATAAGEMSVLAKVRAERALAARAKSRVTVNQALLDLAHG